MTALIIGGCGFIGSHLADALLLRGQSVRVLDRQPERYRPPLAGIEYCYGDFGNRMQLIEALTGVDVVFHLASSAFPGTADLDPVADIRDNLINTINLLHVMRELNVRRIVYLSSGGTVYGATDVSMISEDHPLRPINSYGIVKVASEHYLELYRRTHKFSPIIIRASNPYGPRQGHIGVQGVVSTFLRRIRDNQQIEIWGDGRVVRDFLHVADLATLCVRAAASEHIGTFNAGSGKGHSINDIVDAIRRVTGLNVSPLYKAGRHIDVPRSVLDPSRAENVFGWRCETTLDDGIREFWEWLRLEAR